MQKCEKCRNKFKYKIVLKSLLKKYSPITCKGCGTQYNMNYVTMIIYLILISLPLIIGFFNNDYDIFKFTNTFGSITCYLIWIAVVGLVFPFFARYHTENM